MDNSDNDIDHDLDPAYMDAKRAAERAAQTMREDHQTTYYVNLVGKRAHQLAKEKGWWDQVRSDGECIALMHSELSEALSALRTDPYAACDKGIPVTALEEELADCIIRILDFAEARRLNIGRAIVKKHEYNKTRPYKHGKKF